MPTGSQIRQARAYLGLTQQQFAHRFGLTQSDVSRIENRGAGIPEWLTRRLLVECGLDFPENGGMNSISNASRGNLQGLKRELHRLRKLMPLRFRIQRPPMKIEISDAIDQLADLVRKAESGDEVILTLHGRPAVRLAPTSRPLTAEEKSARIDAIAADARSKALPGPDAAHCSDFLYDPDGLPA